MHYQWIAQQQQLQYIIEQLHNSSVNALDTEFIKVDTLYPKLGVLQINVNQQVYLIDGQLDLSAIWQALFHARQNIFHACGEDIDLMYHYAGQRPIHNVLDTQIAMAFLGYGMQIGYQAAIEKVLNVYVEKDQTRSDWLARPLSPQQEIYAASDVYYLQDLATQLIVQLRQQQLYDFVLEDCRNYCLAIAEQVPIEDIYLDVANYRHSSRQLMQLKQLTSWREQVAVQHNKPRSYIVKNNTLHHLVERPPKTMQQLATQYDLKPSVLREYGKTILKLLNQLPDQSEYPVRLPRPYRYRHTQTKDLVEQHILSVSQTLCIPADVLMRKKWLSQINQFVLNNAQDLSTLSPYLTGWRLEYITQPLLEIIQGDQLEVV